jgi:hypothetical protein
MKSFGINRATGALELRGEVILSATASVGSRGAGADGHQIGNVLKGALAIEAAGFVWSGGRLLWLSR